MEPIKNHQTVVTRHGPPEVLQFVEAEMPEPGPGEVRLKVLAAGVSAFDLIYRRWAHLPGSPRVPFALGEDVVGTVDRLGAGVTSLEVGELVAGGTWVQGVGGGYAEYVCLPERELVPVPAEVDPAEAVCMVVNYLTAHLHLLGFGRAQPGERVLVHGAAGGVGSATLDLGRIAGLEMFGTAAAQNHELVSRLGATPIDYRTEDFVARVRELTGDGMDLVIDTVGGGRQLWRSFRALRRGGRLVWLGSAGTNDHGIRIGPESFAVTFLMKLLPNGKRVAKTQELGPFGMAHHGWYRRTLAELLDHVATGRIKPVIAERMPLAEAARAHALLEAGGHEGKVVLIANAS